MKWKVLEEAAADSRTEERLDIESRTGLKAGDKQTRIRSSGRVKSGE